ncbi:cold-regulated 413 inner membrane protein 1, chloroplastic-like isoform X2 [Camellia sinensis]|uniref:cold-regulated 413 inner membrane protein 1, chloroplastic-like isoform X2 n=1 Tax=Camellia sinensis TaxID=4442 RepID=UPI0010362EE5|nr:cold-regulated 413 inner membrane protein 1, chloroplastic-like isoform X2 [Camellia sinensis]
MLALSLSSPRPFSLYNKHTLSLKSPPHESRLLHLAPDSSFLHFNHFRVSRNCEGMMMMKKKKRGRLGPVCYSAPFTPRDLQWISTVSTAGEYGIWAAFLALLVRLFFFIPGELELPFVSLLLVILAPYQLMNLRGRQEGIIISLIIAGYLAFQHFSLAGSLRRAFDQGSIVATLTIICMSAVPCLCLFLI